MEASSDLGVAQLALAFELCSCCLLPSAISDEAIADTSTAPEQRCFAPHENLRGEQPAGLMIGEWVCRSDTLESAVHLAANARPRVVADVEAHCSAAHVGRLASYSVTVHESMGDETYVAEPAVVPSTAIHVASAEPDGVADGLAFVVAAFGASKRCRASILAHAIQRRCGCRVHANAYALAASDRRPLLAPVE